ncbi:MAG: LD-carboxypeptidase [Alphaproteobacteria bacterium]|nr:LD-carboxypeptidase [Alphaproteobacteria bacterium]
MKTIRIVAPASPINRLTPADFAKIKAAFSKWGYNAIWSDAVFQKDRFLAGSDAVRAQDINAAFADVGVDAIVALKGGYGSPRLLDKIDYDAVRKNPKPFFGFSDITALQLALYARAGLPSQTGFIANYALKPLPPLLRRTLPSALKNEAQTFARLKPMAGGRAQGILVGGTLTLIETLVGTPYLPDMRGKILLLEDVGEEPYKIDRMLTHLRLAGVFNQIGGLVLGQWEKCVAKDKADGTIAAVLRDHFARAPFPVIAGFPYGHAPDHVVVPIGAAAALDADKGTLRIDALR